MYLGVNEQKFLGNGIACFPPQGALLDQSISDLTAVLKQFHLLKTVLPPSASGGGAMG